MLGMTGFDCVFALQHSYSRDRCDTIFRIRFWTQHHPSPLSLIGKRADFSGISNDKTNGPGAGVPTRTLRQGCLYEEEKYLSAVREEPDIYGKVCPTAGEALPERGSRRLILLRQQKASSDPDTVCSQVLAQLLRILTEENTCHSFLLCCFHIDGRIINEYTFLCTQRKPLQKGLIDSRIRLQKPHRAEINAPSIRRLASVRAQYKGWRAAALDNR